MLHENSHTRTNSRVRLQEDGAKQGRQHEDGSVRMAAIEWLHEDGCTRMAARGWLHEDVHTLGGYMRMATRGSDTQGWLHEDGNTWTNTRG